MRSRWFHRPYLHPPAPGVEKKANWLELFYDLVFVAAFIQLGNGLAEHVTIEGLLGFAGTFVPLWLTWTGFSWYMNRYTVDDFVHRLLVFLQMFAVGAMALSAPGVLDNDPVAFSWSCAAALGIVAVLYLRAWKQVPEAKPYSRYWGLVFLVGAVFWGLAAFIPAPWCYVVWGVGSLAILASPISTQSRDLATRFPYDQQHLSERYGLMTIIVLGESFVKVLSALAGEGAGVGLYAQGAVVLLITCCIWWIYFDDVAGSALKTERFGPVIWLYAHLPLQIAITGTGVAVKMAVRFVPTDVAPEGARWLICGMLAMTVFSVAVIDSVTERRQAELSDRTRVGMRVISAALLLLMAPVGGGMAAWTFLLLVVLLCVVQVIFDMMMAPLEAAQHHHAPVVGTAEIAQRRAGGDWSERDRRRLRDLSEAVRKGAPSQLRRDLYVYFLEGSWPRLLGTLIFTYLISNVFFAGLYLMEPGCISDDRPKSFADAFFFSVQTMSTIGYGAMSPASTWGDIVVTIEAAMGLLGVAIATGVMFAKIARPSAGALFAKSMVLHHRDGRRTLAFRVGNARGTEIVDAIMSVSVLKDVITREGHHLRQLYDLELVRARSPIFALSWLVMHVIDDKSPLADVDWSDPRKQVMAIVCTMTGHDATYGQQIFARHIYEPEDVRVDARYVDVVSELEDGRLMIDYERFHDTIDEPVGGGAAESPPAGGS